MKVEDIDIINLILDREYANKQNIPLIECFKPFERHSHVTNSFWLPPESDFGNLTLSLFNIIDRLDLINIEIIKLYKIFFFHKTRREKGNYMISTRKSAEQPFLTEQIIYWLRKTADEFISIIWILKYYIENQVYPDQIKIESIGKHLHSEELLQELGQFNNFLKTLNNISNAYKHSLTNSQISAYRGEEEPLVFAYNLPHNDRKKRADFYAIKFREIIEEYKKFTEECKNILENYSDTLKNK